MTINYKKWDEYINGNNDISDDEKVILTEEEKCKRFKQINMLRDATSYDNITDELLIPVSKLPPEEQFELDADEVIQSLPEKIQQAFCDQDIEALEHELSLLPHAVAADIMDRCIRCGLWSPVKNQDP